MGNRCYHFVLMTTTEIDFNSRFAEVLAEVAGRPKSQILGDERNLLEGTTKRPDILLDIPNRPPCIVECKFDESNQSPVDDLEGKLGQTCSQETKHVAGEKVTIGVALIYPGGAEHWAKGEIPGRFLDEEHLRWKLASLEESGTILAWPVHGWLRGGIRDFWESISRTAMNAESINRLSGKVTELLKFAARRMLTRLQKHPDAKKRIAKMMGEPEDETAGMEIACVVWLDALLMMNELSRLGKKLRSDRDAVQNTSACCTSTGKADVEKIFREWNKVLGDNYESVFKPAKTALPYAEISWGDMSDCFEFLCKAVDEIESARLGKIANIGGEIFARMMQESQRKNSAAFYTKPQVAEFLASLVLPSVHVLPDRWEDWKLADFACGTGSLLRAGYRRLIQFAGAGGGGGGV